MIKRFLSIVAMLSVVMSFEVKADEGMWLLPLIEKYNIGKMTEMGLKLSAEDIYSLNQACLKDAVVIFGNGCTGEIVSSQGLLLTNHHCGFDLIQQHSSVEHDYLSDGYWAMTKADELPNPDLSVRFLKKIEDVTDKVLAEVTDSMTERDRDKAVNKAINLIEKEASENNDYDVTVESFYGDNEYYLVVYEEYMDVRFVGAPPSSIGKYGSENDNWEWPRHTGDFSVFRVYMSPDGKPASYSEDNIPYKPEKWLSVSLKGFEEDDFAMILGYPGSTERYYTSYEVNELLNIENPGRVKIRGIKQDIWMKDMKADPKINIQYSSKYYSSSNYWKFSIGQNRQLKNLNVINKKLEIEKQFNTWMNAEADRKAKYGDVLNIIKSAVEGRADYEKAVLYFGECLQGCEIIGFFKYGNRLKKALESGDTSKTGDAVRAIRSSLDEIYKDYSPSTDRKSTTAMLTLLREDLDKRFHPDFYKNIVDKKFKGDVAGYVNYIFKKSVFVDRDRFNAFLDNPKLKTLERDPIMLFYESIGSVFINIIAELGKYDEELYKGQRLWVAALREMMPEKTEYPDANFTMRLTYGKIKDYEPKDAVTFRHYTTLQGVIDKYIPGDFEFDLPQRLIDLNAKKEFGRYADKEGYMPVCFLTTNDITGGNSGSPVLNGNGELIGLAFDGNWEAMSGDVYYEPELQRTIAVDIRYVLWIMDIYSGAGHLVDEMTIVAD